MLQMLKLCSALCFYKSRSACPEDLPHLVIHINFVMECDLQGNNEFYLTTPLRTVSCQCKHEVAASEWVTKIRDLHTKNGTKGLYIPLHPMKDVKYDHHRCP